MSEFTPLRKDEVPSVGTALDLNNYGVESTSSPQTAPRKTVIADVAALQHEFHQLLLPFEILVIASMVAVLRNSLHTVWNSQTTALQGAVLVCAFILVLLGAVFAKEILTCEQCYKINSNKRRCEKIKLMRLDWCK